jgi:O-antigen biosynthesis protein
MSAFDPLDYPVCFTMPMRLDSSSAWIEHIPFGMLIIDLLRPKVLVELGTQMGVSYCAFCQAVKQLGLNTRCYAIDTWKGDDHATFYSENVLIDLRIHHDSLYSGFSELIQSTFDNAIHNFPDGSIDILHIDGLHTYEAVKHDFKAWLPKLSDSAVVLFHDTNVRERNFGVWKLWSELQQKYPNFEFLHGYGLGVLGVGKGKAAGIEPFFSLSDQDTKQIREFFLNLGSYLSVISRKDYQIQSLQKKFVEQSELLQTVTIEKENQEKTFLAQIQELNEIKNSRAWHLVQTLRQVQSWLKPQSGKY